MAFEQNINKALIEVKPSTLDEYKVMLHKFMEMVGGVKIEDPLCGKSEEWWRDRWSKYVGEPGAEAMDERK